VTVLALDPQRTRLVLHAGSAEPTPGLAWRAGPQVSAAEQRSLVAAFNGGFKERDARGGWFSEGRAVTPLVPGAASVVIYADGTTDIGSWWTEVPAPGRTVASVRQNLRLLIDRGTPQRTHPVGQRQLDLWWGHAFRGQPLISRSALGITASGSLVWAAGTKVTVAALAWTISRVSLRDLGAAAARMPPTTVLLAVLLVIVTLSVAAFRSRVLSCIAARSSSDQIFLDVPVELLCLVLLFVSAMGGGSFHW